MHKIQNMHLVNMKIVGNMGMGHGTLVPYLVNIKMAGWVKMDVCSSH